MEPRRLVLALCLPLLVACAPAADGPDVADGVGDQAVPSDAASPSPVEPSDPVTPSPAAQPATPSPSPSPSPSPAAGEGAQDAAAPTDAALAAAGVDELGRVPVLAWHYVTDDEDGVYRTSLATLRAQLEDLYDRGYRPVTQAEFAAGTFPIPLGTSPVVLTFDDSTRGQFALTEDGRPDPATAVGVLEDFAASHDDWRATAVFSVTFPQPFGDSGFAPKLRWLHEHGYEFANHSYGHESLAGLSPQDVAANLARNASVLREAVPGADYGALTLPFGSRSDGDRSAELAGSADGVAYAHDLVYLFGAYPTRNPNDAGYDPLEVQRVPATAVASEGLEWLTDRLDDLERDGTRFVSDGDATTVTVPADRVEDLRAGLGDDLVRVYDPGSDG